MAYSLPAQISSKDVAQNPTDPYRIIPILEEIRKVWDSEPGKTFGQILRRIVETEYLSQEIFNLTDDEFLAALQNYSSQRKIDA